MRSFAGPQKQAAPQKSPGATASLIRTQPHSPQQDLAMELQRSIGNQAVMRLVTNQARSCDASGTGADRLAQNFARIPVSAGPALRTQPELMVNSPGDAYEQEADRVARMQMKASGPESAGCIEAPPIVAEVLRSPGQPLDAATRAFMEPRFGWDFSRVRVHTDEKAAESSRAVQAKAYTVGSNVVFAAGEYAPGTNEGQRLLGHELAHVAQQVGSPGVGARLQRQHAPKAPDPRATAKQQHQDQQRNVAKLLDDARGWKKDKDFEKLAEADKLYVNTIELLDHNRMDLVILTPTHYSTPQDLAYFDDRVKYPNVGGDYLENPKFRSPDTIVAPPGPATRGTTDVQQQKQLGFVPTIPPKQETDPLGGTPAAPPKAPPQTPPVLQWVAAVVRLFLDATPVSQGELRNVFVHEGQHVADLNYLKSSRLSDWTSMLELYKSEFRAFWLQPPIPMGGGRFRDETDTFSEKDQETLTIDESRKCDACTTPAGSKPSSRSQRTKMKNARQKDIFMQLMKNYPKDEFDCFYVCNKGFRDAVDAFDLPVGENLVNSVRLLDLRLELQNLTPGMSVAELQKTKFIEDITALDDMDWAFLKDTKRSEPLWDLIKGFTPSPIYKALRTVSGKKNPAKEVSKALDAAVKKMK